jgi:S1-C subfamily serine protease
MRTARMVVAGLVLSMAGPLLADDASASNEFETLRKAQAPNLVTVKFVQKTQSRFGDFDGENEITGVMVDPAGLVLCSNTMLSGRGRGGARAVPTEIKVLIGSDTLGQDATFVARDTELDLAWLKIKKPAAEPYAFLDMSRVPAETHVQTGQRVLSLGVMGRFFGQEVLVTEGTIAGRTRKPRELYVVRGALDTDPGLPVFDAAGQLLGVATIQAPDAEEMAGSSANLIARGRGLILPASVVSKATARAKELAAQGAQVTAAPTSAPAEEPAAGGRERATAPE